MRDRREERCKSQFDEHLRILPHSETIEWRDGDEPPDYFLTVGGVEYAVEVTSLMQTFPVGRAKLSMAGVNNSLVDFVAQVDRRARAAKFLRGTYLVSFRSALDDLPKIRETLQVGLLDYIRDTRHLDVSPQQTIYQVGRQSCRIEKSHAQSDKVVPILPVHVKWEGDAANELCDLIQERIATKAKKLHHLQQPKILLLYDSYLFAGPKMFRDCMRHPSQAETMFHTIFVAQEQNGFVLWSQNPDWL